MKKFVLLYLFFLVFIAVATTSNAFSLKNDQIQKHVITLAESEDSVDEESILDGGQGLLEQDEQIGKKIVAPKIFLDNPAWRKNEIDPGIFLGNPDSSKNEIDPGIFLGNPDSSKNEIDPGIFLGDSERPKNEIDLGIE